LSLRSTGLLARPGLTPRARSLVRVFFKRFKQPPRKDLIDFVEASTEPIRGQVIQISSPEPPPPPAPIPAPTTLSATAVSNSQIKLAWTDNSTGEDGFKIERSRDQITWTLVGTVGPNIAVFQNTGLRRNTLYHYRVRAYLGTSNSSYSNVASARTPKK
jgi:hypothetical protein